MRSITSASILLLLCGAIAGGCSKKPELIEPPPAAFNGKAAWIVAPVFPSHIIYYGLMDSVKWALNPTAGATRVYIEYERDSSFFTPWFDARADSLRRGVVIPFEPKHRYRFRIRGNTSSAWDTSGSFLIYEIHRIIFPSSSLTLTQGMRITLRHTAYGNPPLALAYLTNRSGTWIWNSVAGPAVDPDVLVTKGMLLDAPIHLRLRDSTTGAEYLSDLLAIRDFVNPEFGLTTKFTGKRFLAGQEIPIIHSSMHGPVAFDLSTNSGASWSEVIPLTAAPVWHVQIAKPSGACRMRMRADDPAFPVMIESGDFEIDTTAIQFRVTWPHEGDVLRAGDYIHPTFVSAVGDSVIFSLSTDGGATWLAPYHSPWDDPASVETDFGMFILGAPSSDCRIRMISRNGLHSNISERFSIADDLADFFPIDVGVTWRYHYSKRFPSTSTESWWSFRVDRKEIGADTIKYFCTVRDSAAGRATAVHPDLILESRQGLHAIRAHYLPLTYIPARYFSAAFQSVRVDQYRRGANILEWYGTIERGVGFTKHFYTQYLGNPGRITEWWEIIP